MTTPTPWQLLFDDQNKRTGEAFAEWLRLWIFSNDAAALLIDRRAIKTAAGSGSEEQNQPLAILLIKGEWQRTVH
jgi:hypothetical protein